MLYIPEIKKLEKVTLDNMYLYELTNAYWCELKTLIFSFRIFMH